MSLSNTGAHEVAAPQAIVFSCDRRPSCAFYGPERNRVTAAHEFFILTNNIGGLSDLGCGILGPAGVGQTRDVCPAI